eukprot:CAMPEP_0194537544 /NCGR_PEP_ID=MMETSP0253-20130528/76848_1 /TAXON_ID=2966 /ORGANISM="Noctiluca scintillans" /LENGTH=670 /DNA_ID=CAMNT_0039383575 /DNA_START=8 /DNA_END=2020 /DNA_ORIENTATION=+
MAVAFGMRNRQAVSGSHPSSKTPSVPRSLSRSVSGLHDSGGVRLVQRSQNSRNDSPVRAPLLPIARCTETGADACSEVVSRPPEPIVTWLLDTERPLGTKYVARDTSPPGPRSGTREKRGLDPLRASQASVPVSPGTSTTRASQERNVDARRIELLEEELGKLAEVTKDLSAMWDARFEHLMVGEERQLKMNVKERLQGESELRQPSFVGAEHAVPNQNVLNLEDQFSAEAVKEFRTELSQFQERTNGSFSDLKSDMVMLNFRVADLEVRNSELEQHLAQHPHIPDVDRLHARLDRGETLIEAIQKAASLGSPQEVTDLSDRVGKLANRLYDMETLLEERTCEGKPHVGVNQGVANGERDVEYASGRAGPIASDVDAPVQDLLKRLTQDEQAITEMRQACNLAFEKHVQKFIEMEAKLGTLDRNIISVLELKCLRGRIDGKELELSHVKQATALQGELISELKSHVQRLDVRLDDVDARRCVQGAGIELDSSMATPHISDIMYRLDSVERGKADTVGLIHITEVVKRNGKSIDSLQDSVGALASHFHRANGAMRDGNQFEMEISHCHWAEPLAPVTEVVEEEYEMDEKQRSPCVEAHGASPESEDDAGCPNELSGVSEIPLTSARLHRRIAEVPVVPETHVFLDGDFSGGMLGLDTDVRPIKAHSERHGL